MEGAKANVGPFTNWLTVDRLIDPAVQPRSGAVPWSHGVTGKQVLKTRTSNQWYYTN